MPIIYFDNFRGFESTFLPLKEFNFFVGENSTGKSSVLKLIGILSSLGFWRYNIFGEDETSLGVFSEIMTARSKKDFFEIGLLGNKPSPNSQITSAFKLRFIENESYPFVKEICYRDEKINIQATIEGVILKYRYKLVENYSCISEDNIDEFKLWILNNELNKEQFLRIKIDNRGLEPLLYQIQSLINLDLEKTSGDELLSPIKIVIPSILNNIAWFGPTVAKPEKTYEQLPLVFNSYGKHFPSVLRDIISVDEVKNILNKFGSDSGLYDNIDIKHLSNNSDDSFEIQININNRLLNITNVGYGVSQILPLIVESIARPNNTWITSQQPETHLHPKAQAALGDFIYKSNEIDGQKFILETHSDYIIDRFRLRLNRSYNENQKIEEKKGQVVFFSKVDSGNIIDLLEIKHDGSYNDPQPAGFRDFFIKEQLSLIKI